MVKTTILLSGAAGWVAAIAFVAAATSHHHLSETDQAFLTSTAIVNNYQLGAARLAQLMARSNSDRSDAGFMILEDTRLGADMKSAAARSDGNFRLPAGIDPVHQKLLARLRDSGDDFFGEYAKQMTASHLAMRKLYGEFLSRSDADRGIQAAIKGALPTVEVHLQMAKALLQR